MPLERWGCKSFSIDTRFMNTFRCDHFWQSPYLSLNYSLALIDVR